MPRGANGGLPHGQSSIHPVALVPFSTRKRGLSLSMNWAMKRPSATSLPVRCYSSFLLLGANVSMIALI